MDIRFKVVGRKLFGLFWLYFISFAVLGSLSFN